ncbi:SUKH-4 family immunity protein [Streptomyces odonnellii]|uniref:SUKH-4 family immunity protein n=1 Tax=Streptomyces odonnellii TaxID=1417980 RepID=UPI00069739AA|nr:SUKH-4 family immunity protein [Streptomyces odonnellii]
MEYVPQWLTSESWDESGSLDLDADVLSSAPGWPEAVREALAVAREYGMPSEVDGMFYPSPHGGAFTQAGPDGGFWRLGQHEPQLGEAYVFEYVLDGNGRVVLLDPALPAPRFVNTSLVAFLDALAAWDHRNRHLDDFDELEPEDDDEEEDPAEAARVAFGMEIAAKLKEKDPSAFTDEFRTWWDRVYEEVELDAV